MTLPGDERKCLTPGAIFVIGVHSDRVEARVDFPAFVALTEGKAAAIEARIHDALEAVLAGCFEGRKAA